MRRIERSVQIVFVLLVCISGLLLGFSQRDATLAYVAVVSALGGFFLSDIFRWVQLRSWVANVLSIVVLFFAMRTFFGGDSGSQLVAVANLLVYLQLVLLFQEKSPRLYWQVSVLSLLQVVVATIFNLKFDGGIFFIIYMFVAAAALSLLTIYHQAWDARRNAKKNKAKFESQLTSNNPVAVNATPLAMFDQTVQDNKLMRRVAGQLCIWVTAALGFSSIIFYTTPRLENAWFGPKFFSTSETGANKELELDERERIQLSTEVVMHAKFIDPLTGEELELREPPYFRGIALSNVTIEDNQTRFLAPYDRIYGNTYEELYYLRENVPQLEMQVTLEPTADPLIYACTPTYLDQSAEIEGRQGIEFCHEISAVTRKRQGDKIEMSAFKYTLAVPTVQPKTLPKMWSYMPETEAPSGQTMLGNIGQFRWLTHLEEDQYPELVQIAEVVARRAPNPQNSLSVARELMQYFTLSDEFEYTLDFTTVNRDESLDSIEDFVRNHKTGHCSLYSAALCLMLRSQGIPARVVVGYMGGSYNEMANTYVVSGRHAHAWVEAYIPPGDYGTEVDPGMYGENGVWVTLDPTPGTSFDFSAGEDALDLARTLWQDYVLGLDTEQQAIDSWMSGSSSRVLGLLDIEAWTGQLQDTADAARSNPLISGAILLVVIGLMVGAATRKQTSSNKSKRNKKTGKIRRLFGRAVSLISPNLGTWLIHGSDANRVVPFYEEFEAVVGKFGHKRNPEETHREFASKIIEQYSNKPGNSEITRIVGSITEHFNQVRFGEHEIKGTNELLGDLKILQSALSERAITQ